VVPPRVTRLEVGAGVASGLILFFLVSAFLPRDSGIALASCKHRIQRAASRLFYQAPTR